MDVWKTTFDFVLKKQNGKYKIVAVQIPTAQSLDNTKKIFNATYTFWEELKSKGIFHTDTFWYFEPFAWVTQMMKIFKWDFKTEEDGWPVKLSYICVFFLKRSSISFGFFFHS